MAAPLEQALNRLVQAEGPAPDGGRMLRSRVLKRSLHSSCCPIAADDGRNNLSRALTSSALFFGILTVLFLMAGTSLAQEATGAIVGTVVDPSGAALNGVKVTATDVERGTTLTATSNESGSFNLPRVPIG